MEDMSRRKFMFTSLAATAGTVLIPGDVSAKEQCTVYAGGLAIGAPKPLPYKSIPGFLSEEQITPHYTGHYGGALRSYVTTDKKLQLGIAEGTSIDASTYGAVQRARTNKANSVILHELYFDGMTAKESNPGWRNQYSDCKTIWFCRKVGQGLSRECQSSDWLGNVGIPSTQW